MEQDIYKIYHNNFGIAFKWKHKSLSKKIQLVFRDMGFYLTIKEIKQFKTLITKAKTSSPCANCKANCNERFILLKTPSDKIDIAINKKELHQLYDLINGAIFKLELDEYVTVVSKN